ncbi:unnamed protein product [Ranitomeya imitator]|uniref:Roadblock/LAMTOR2 domain-containing protein n=1 Tax=Ranitomeya imitator TaxID=111125 RepID=A0ABN9MEE7_9NEOB|nr:unnamed protein product [Ranitomeya imitator]
MVSNSRDRADVEETLKRIQSQKGVQGIIIVNSEGIPIKSTMDNATTAQYAGLMHQLVMKARSSVRDIDPQNDLTFLRVRSKKNEIMIAPGPLERGFGVHISTLSRTEAVVVSMTIQSQIVNIVTDSIKEDLNCRKQGEGRGGLRGQSPSEPSIAVGFALMICLCLKVGFIIQYKTTTLIHKALHGSAPPYISSLVSVYHPTRALRSANDLSNKEPAEALAQ